MGNMAGTLIGTNAEINDHMTTENESADTTDPVSLGDDSEQDNTDNVNTSNTDDDFGAKVDELMQQKVEEVIPAGLVDVNYDQLKQVTAYNGTGDVRDAIKESAQEYDIMGGLTEEAAFELALTASMTVQ